MIGAYIPRGLRTESTTPLLPAQRTEIRQHLKYVSIVIGALSTVAIIYITAKCISDEDCIEDKMEFLIRSN